MLPKDALRIAEGIHRMRVRGAGQIARSAVEALEITAQWTPSRACSRTHQKFVGTEVIIQAGPVSL